MSDLNWLDRDISLMETVYGLPVQEKPERAHLYRWIEAEEEYVFDKFDQRNQRGDHDETWAEGIDAFWSRQIIQYIDRARQFLAMAATIEDPERKRALEMRAQQAMAKCMMTAKGCVESMIRVFGPLPEPGHPSGEVRPWPSGS